MDVSGGVIDVSGGVIDVSAGVVDVSAGVVDVSGISIDVSGAGMAVSGERPLYVAPPPRVTIADILAAQEVLVLAENIDRSSLNSISQISVDSLKTVLIQWASTGFPNSFVIQDITISPPPRCSDGVTRSLAEYIAFCSGKTIQEHILLLQDMLPDIVVGFIYTGSSIQIVVSRPTV
jgi:hypothetical protein